MKHTQGKWTVAEGNQTAVLVTIDNTIVPQMGIIVLSDNLEQAQVNARLIAAAPDLLAACKDLLGNTFLEQDPNSEWFICSWCGRKLPEENGQPIPCTSDDCPSYKAKNAITKAQQADEPER